MTEIKTTEIKTNWAKIFDTKLGQVLIYHEWDADSEQYIIHRIIKLDDAFLDLKSAHPEEKDMLIYFALCSTQEKVEEYAKDAVKLLATSNKKVA